MFKLKSQYFPQSIGNARGQTTWAGSRQDFAFVMLTSPWPVQVFRRGEEHNPEQEGVDMEGLDILDPKVQFVRSKLQHDVRVRNEFSDHRSSLMGHQSALAQSPHASALP
jgi:hypothetical protein